MRQLYLVYRVLPDGDRRPDSIMALDEADLATAAATLDKLVSEDNPDFALRPGESWEFVPQDQASVADWEEIAPPDGRSMPY